MFPKIPASKMSLAKRKPIYGKGINDADYIVNPKVGGKRFFCPIYTAWARMLGRSYSEKFQKKNATYKGVSVCDEWLVFSEFSRWYEKNHINGYELDKDIKIKGNKVYSPQTCIFAPKEINSLLTDSAATRGELPIGVSICSASKPFHSKISIDGKCTHIGRFFSPEEAHDAYKSAKNKEILRKMKKFPEFSKYLEQHLYEV